MLKFWARGASLLFLILLWTPARASGDFTCAPSWTLLHTQFTGCDSTALLGPGNDTRVNLHLLLLDRHTAEPNAAARIGDATPFSWATFEDALAGKPAAPEDDVSEDVAPQASQFAAGEGSRCLSNAGGAAGFEEALAAARRLPPDERSRLSDARKAMQPSCEANTTNLTAVNAAVDPVRSSAGKPFAAYLQGAAAFYDGDFDTARARFANLQKAESDWLRQSARYMSGRVELNAAQAGAFDDYGALVTAKVEATDLAAAEAGLKAYLREYPAGLYAASARGLLRRVYWLGGNLDKLTAEYVWQFTQSDPRARNLTDGDLAQEIDAKLLDNPAAAGAADPVILAVLDFKRMRHDGAKDAAKALSLADLQAQKPRFAGEPALYDYLLAAHAWFVEDRPAEVVRLIPPEAPTARLTNLELSRQLLRAMALDRLGDPGAYAALSRLIPVATGPFQRGPVELALAMHDERRGEVDRVFAPGSPILDPSIRRILLRHAAGPKLLRAQGMAGADPGARSALFILLYKELTRGDYAAFLRDVKLAPLPPPPAAGESQPSTGEPDFAVFTGTSPSGEFSCPELRETAARLARNASQARARLCLAEFVRLKGFDHTDLDNPPPADELGGAPSQFPGGEFSRMAIYRSVIDSPTASADDRAYALFRAVYCYAPSGNNDCGGKDIPVDQRKAWFRLLKSRYPSSPWAADLKFYW